MTIETQDSKVHYVGNGSTTVFPVPFPVYQAGHVKVVLTDASGVDTPLTGGYTVTGAGTGAVSVTYPTAGAALPMGHRITIYRKLPLVQQLDLENGGAFDAENIERSFDLQEMQIQQLQEAADRTVTVPITSDVTPEELMRDLFGAADSAAADAAAAANSAGQAAASAQGAAASATLAEQLQEWACACADRSESARDVALDQVVTVNTIMATELGKINAIVAVNKDDQQDAVTAARRWAEADPGVAVAVGTDGAPRYSARHWANEAREIAVPVATDATRGSVRIGSGLIITEGDLLNVAVKPLRFYREEITVSGMFVARHTGMYRYIIQAGGGGGGGIHAYGLMAAGGGAAGEYIEGVISLTQGQAVSVVIGAGGTGGPQNTAASNSGGAGGNSSFGDIIALGGSGGVGFYLTQSVSSMVFLGAGGAAQPKGRNGGSGTVYYTSVTTATTSIPVGVYSGQGADSLFGAGGQLTSSYTGAVRNSPGRPGQGYGSGGSGAATNESYASGGAGKQGIVIVEYIGGTE